MTAHDRKVGQLLTVETRTLIYVVPPFPVLSFPSLSAITLNGTGKGIGLEELTAAPKQRRPRAHEGIRLEAVIMNIFFYYKLTLASKRLTVNYGIAGKKPKNKSQACDSIS